MDLISSLAQGLILADFVDYFNYAYFEILPLQFLWTEQVVQSLAVGMTVGIYGLAANHSGEEERAFILGRMDACLSVTAIFGFALAAPTFEFFTGWSDIRRLARLGWQERYLFVSS